MYLSAGAHGLGSRGQSVLLKLGVALATEGSVVWGQMNPPAWGWTWG